MPPKKHPARNGNAKPALPGIKHVLRPFGSSDSESDSSNPLRLSQTILGAHNSLKQLLSGPPAAMATPPKKRGRKPKVRAPELPVHTAQTPMSRLKRATALLELPQVAKRPVQFDDIAPPRKRGRPRKNPTPADILPPTTNILPPKRQRQPKKAAKAKLLQPKDKPTRAPPLPPLDLPRGGASVFDDSDDYVEQVSHHTLELAAPEPPAPGATTARRASYSNRGKRMLSVGNGYEAKPHSEVPEAEYYKVLDPDMPEPSRMRQLLVWCFRKKLERDGDTGSGSDTARGISKIINQELLADLVDGDISTSWYSRGATDGVPVVGKRIVRPNPLNEANRESLEVFLRKLRQLEQEHATWHRAFDHSVQPLNLLAVNAHAEPTGALAAYLDKPDTRSMVEEVLQERMVKQMERSQRAVQTAVEEDIGPAVDRLYHVLHRMKQAVELVERLGRERLSSQVAHVVRRYMDRAHAVADKPLLNKELLRGILRLDAPVKR